MSLTWQIVGGRLVDPVHGRDETGEILVCEGRIVDALPAGCAATRIDAGGLTVVPGFIDLHVHLREPGNEAAETIATGSASAARGGFTTIVAMPNTTPATDTPERVRTVIKRGKDAGLARVRTSACITLRRAGGALTDLQALAAAGAVAFTDDGATVRDDALMAEALIQARRLGLPVMDHALDPVLSADGVMHKGRRSAELGFPGIPSEAEARTVERDIRLAGETGGAMHIQHMSTRRAVELLREARQRGVPVSGEVTPHHIALTDADIPDSDPDYKMAPPLREAQDRDALVEAVADGTIAAFATDHAPHRADAKAAGFMKAPCGVLGMETAVGVTYTKLVQAGHMRLQDWVKRWTVGPAEILGIPAPNLSPGAHADIALLDLESPWTVDPAQFLSRSRNTPFKGWTLTGRSVLTLCGGERTWNGRS